MRLKRDGRKMKSRKEKQLIFIYSMKKVSEHPTLIANFPNSRTVQVILSAQTKQNKVAFL